MTLYEQITEQCRSVCNQLTSLGYKVTGYTYITGILDVDIVVQPEPQLIQINFCTEAAEWK